MEQEKIKHLEFIQNIITRMNTNSFQIKGWMITIVSALLALYASSNNYLYVFVAIVPTLIFWLLDSYYLRQERRFRGLYGDVIDTNKNITVFSMDISQYKDGRYNYLRCLFSPTTVLLYLVIICSLVIVGLFLVNVL